MTASLPTHSLPLPSTETISGAYIVRITSKCFPCLHRSMNFPATVSMLMAISLFEENIRWCDSTPSNDDLTKWLEPRPQLRRQESWLFPRSEMPAFGQLVVVNELGIR